MNRLIMIFLGIIITSILVPQGVNGGIGDVEIVFGDMFFNINLPAPPPPVPIIKYLMEDMDIIILLVNETDIYVCPSEVMAVTDKCIYVG